MYVLKSCTSTKGGRKTNKPLMSPRKLREQTNKIINSKDLQR